MTDLDTIARRHAEQARAVVADAQLPRLDTGRRLGVRWVSRPVWAAVIAAAAVILVFALQWLLVRPEGDGVVATTVPDSIVIVGQEGGFVPTESMTEACAWCTAVLLNDGRVLVVGGPIAEIYDPVTWTFTSTGRNPGSSFQIIDAVLLDDGRVLVLGVSESGHFPLQVEIYDPDSDSFRSIEGPQGEGSAAVGLSDGRVLVVGGELAGDGLNAALVFDPGLERFTATGLPNVDRHSAVTATLLDDGRVLVAGGEPSGTAEIYDPQANTFTMTGSLNTVRDYFTATRLLDGRVLIVGGSDEGNAALASAEIYDPETGAFTPTGPMAAPRFWHAAVRLPDGRVLVIGGGDGRGDRTEESTAEIFDPATGRFTQGPPPTTSRLAATAVALDNGQVLVLGHYPGNVASSSAGSETAEIFSLAPLERPAGCCPDNPTEIIVEATTESRQVRGARLVIPAGALKGATEAFYNYTTGSSGGGGELPLPQDCDLGCEVQIPSGGTSVWVQIVYEGEPPPQAESITIVIETAPPDQDG